MARITRTTKFAVSFPGHRKKDLSGKDGLWYQLTITQSDLGRAANHIITVLDMVSRGILSKPLRENGEEVPFSSLAYELMKADDAPKPVHGPWCVDGRWRPLGEPAYVPKTLRRLGGGCRADLGRYITQRYQNDRKALRTPAGRDNAPHSLFRPQPIPIRKQEVRFGPEHTIVLTLWAREPGRSSTVTVRAVKPGKGQIAILNRIRSGEYTHGNAKLFKDRRKGKWMLALSYSGEVQEAEGDLIAGVDLGMATTVMLAYIKQDGEAKDIRDRICIPESSLRAWEDIERRRRQVGHFNRDTYGLRTGRGRDRKLRPLASLGDKRARSVDTAIRQVAAATVRALQGRGASVLAVEDLKGISECYLDETEGLSKKKAAQRRRKRFLHWQQYKLRTYIEQAAEKAGILVIRVNPAYTSKTCSKCGIVWTTTQAPTVRKKVGRGVQVEPPGSGLGRHGQRFKCSCGHEDNADFNAAINIARRGLVNLQTAGGVQVAAK